MKKAAIRIVTLIAALILMGGTAFANGNAELTLLTNMACDKLTMASNNPATVIVGAHTLDVGAEGIDISNMGTLTSGAGTIKCAGNWANSGTFTSGTGTVVFDGAGTQEITSGGSSFYGMDLDNDLAFQDALVATGSVNLASGKTIETSNDVTFLGTIGGAGTFNASGGTVTYNRGGDQSIFSGTYSGVSFDGGGTKTLLGAATINNTLTFTDGLVSLGDNNLTLRESATVSGTPSAAKMIVTNGTGILKKVFSGTGSFTFPVGSNGGTAEYSPATLDFTSGTLGADAWAGVKVTNSKQLNNTSTTNYLNRYWTVTQSGISNFSCSTTFNYLPGDVVGTEASIYGAQWDGSEWTVFDPVTTATHSFEATVTSFSDFTGVARPAPDTQAKNLGFSSVTQTQMKVSWTRGNGDNVLVVAHLGSAVSSNPVDGTDYTASTSFGIGAKIGTGNYVVYKGTGISVTVTGLTASTTCHFRAYEYNDSGGGPAYNTATATGNPKSQMTLPNVPDVPVATAATAITETGFAANWNAATGVVRYRLDVATNNGFTSFVSGYNNKDVGNVTTFAITGLSPGTPYFYRVRAENIAGTSANSNIISATTLCSAPVTIEATFIAATGFTANWNAVTGATGYRLDVAVNKGFTSFVTNYENRDVGNVTTFAVTGLSAATAYFYRVRACLEGAASENSNTISVITLDGTGVPADIQDAAPNNGDGNGDGIKDSLQTNVASLPSATTGGSYLTVALTGCGQLEAVETSTYASVGNPDPGYEYPFDLVGFNIPCGNATVRIYYHGANTLEDYIYRKYGPTPADWNAAIWYTMPGVTFGTKEIGGKTVFWLEFVLTEAHLGDDTHVFPIVDQGGVAHRAITISTLNEWGMIILGFLTVGMALWAIRRRRLQC